MSLHGLAFGIVTTLPAPFICMWFRALHPTYGSIDVISLLYSFLLPIINSPGFFFWAYFGPLVAIALSGIFWALLLARWQYPVMVLKRKKQLTWKTVIYVIPYLLGTWFLSGILFESFVFGGGSYCAS